METTSVYHFAILVGVGIALGMFGAITLIVALSKSIDWIITKTYKKIGVAKWVFGTEYNHYQHVMINGVKWQVLPSPNPRTLLLAHHANRQNGKDNKHIIIDSFNGPDLSVELLAATEVSNVTKTDAVTA